MKLSLSCTRQCSTSVIFLETLKMSDWRPIDIQIFPIIWNYIGSAVNVSSRRQKQTTQRQSKQLHVKMFNERLKKVYFTQMAKLII